MPNSSSSSSLNSAETPVVRRTDKPDDIKVKGSFGKFESLTFHAGKSRETPTPAPALNLTSTAAILEDTVCVVRPARDVCAMM